ncbi:Ceramide glucosyltransferase [Fusarium oxysporum f. sp. albedinis]|nr:Ceramide glucosyltransferase [Fusarium oxysporum f. sp. albedinis]
MPPSYSSILFPHESAQCALTQGKLSASGKVPDKAPPKSSTSPLEQTTKRQNAIHQNTTLHVPYNQQIL